MKKTLHIGRVCKKTRGKEAGEVAVIVDIIDENYALVDGPSIKRRRCNFGHLEPTDKVVDIKKGATHEEVVKALGAQ
jgi:large subunit ribosomal protein L14e